MLLIRRAWLAAPPSITAITRNLLQMAARGPAKPSTETFAVACTHLWTPLQVQAVFEEDWHVVGRCHLSGL
jgi:hypothetical protein